MTKRENFTAGRIAKLECEPGKQQSIYSDAGTPGLGLRVTSTGAKSYIFETKLNGKNLRVTIGDVRTWSLGKAQEEATSLKALTDKGIDPRQQKAEALAAADAKKAAGKSAKLAAGVEAMRQTVTMREAWLAYIDAKRSAKKDGKPLWCARYATDHEYAIAGKDKPAPLASLADLRLIELTPERLAKWLRDEANNRPTSANIAFRKLRSFLAWCGTHQDYKGLVAADACKADAVVSNLPKQKAKIDNLQREQLPLWFAEVGKLPLVVSAFLRVLLLTGARRGELAGLTWDKVDFQWNSLTIKDKIEEQRIIPLTPFVASLLAQLPRRSQWVFSSPTAASGRIEGPHVAHMKALMAAGLPHVSIHGLRRSFKSLSEWVEIPVGVVAQIMGHAQSATAERHYTVRPLDLLRVWHSRYEAWLLEQAGIEFDAKTVQAPLRVVA